MIDNTYAETTFIEDFLPQFRSYLQRALPGLQRSLLENASTIVKDNAVNIQKWTIQSSTGALSVADLRWLIKSQLDWNSLHMLKEAGLSLVKVDEMKQAVVSSLLTTIFKVNIFK